MKAKLLVFLILAVTPVALRTQTPSDSAANRLPAVVITATRVPVSQAAAPASVTVISGDDLRERGISMLYDALRETPSVSVALGGSAGALTSVFLRGGESDFVKVLIDGVAVNDPGGSFDFAHLSTENVDRVEIVRGPSSVLYGSDAVAGLVQIFTRAGAAKTAALVSASVRGGSNKTLEYDGSVLGNVGRVGYSVAGLRSTTDGILPFNNRYWNNTLSGALRFQPRDGSDIQLSVRHSDAEFHYPTSGSGVPDDSNAFRTERRLSLGADAVHFVLPWLEARALLGHTGIDALSDDQPDNASDTLGFYAYSSSSDVMRRSADFHLNAYLRRGAVLTGGTEYSVQRDRNVSLSKSEFGDFPAEPFDRSRENTGLYGQLIGSVGSKVSYTLGARLDENQRFGTFATYRMGVGARPLPATLIRAAAGSGFKEPTFFEQFATGFVEGNPHLDPEQSRSWEVGLEQRVLADRLMIAATFFSQRFRQLIQYASTPEGQPDFLNVAAANASGLELEARMSPIARLRITASYTNLKTEVIDAGFDEGAGAIFVKGGQLLRRARHNGGFTATYADASGAALGIAAHYSGKREDRDFGQFPAVPVELPAYTTVDFSGSVPLLTAATGGTRIMLTARLQNAFNESYQDVFGFRTPGRTVLLGARVGSR